MEHRKLDSRRRGFDVDLDDVVYGTHAVAEAISAGERLRRIHIGDERKRDPTLRRLIAGAREAQIPIRFESRAFFASFPHKAHQSVVAVASPFEYVSLDQALANRKKTRPALFLVLDHITDPHNLGAIIRTAECSGVDAVVIPERRAAGVNATVRKAAAGAAAYVQVARVTNIAASVRALKKAGLWIAGAASDPSAVLYTEADLAGDVALVIGAEGSGISQLVRRECDYLVRIPLEGKVASLNASVAAGILLYEALRQRRS
jgi:23S rRNA (guanosine2251-2'-O)-methyltransferase